MFAKWLKLLGRPDPVRQPSIPSGERVYAVGDIHGRADLFDDLITRIETDDAARGKARTTIVLLGDLIDRGPESAKVVARARDLTRRRQVRIIQGNHEEMLLVSRESVDSLRGFLRFGGRETILSYGVDARTLDAADVEQVQAMMNEAIPAEDFTFMAGFEKMVRIGDYLFVHAGVRPDRSLDNQLGQDCRWIREPFLSHRGDYGAFVVHGHTITEQPDLCVNRIGIDTGAFVHGTLTAIGLEGTDRWFLQARDPALALEAA